MGNKIIFEGLDGSGKSVVSKKVAKALNYGYVDSPLDIFQNIRRKINDYNSELAKLHFYLSSNLALSEYLGSISSGIVCSRYYYSTIVDYSIKLNKTPDKLMSDLSLKHDDFYKPNLVILLTVSPMIQKLRIESRNKGINTYTDQLCLTDDNYLKSSNKYYMQLYQKLDWKLIDTTKLTIEGVVNKSLGIIKTYGGD